MSRQPVAGARAAIARSPSGVAARASAPSPSPSSPLPPQRYRALRARYNALLVTLYERSTLTLREIAAVAGHTDRAVQMLVRALGCRPRNAKACRPGTDTGVRRGGPRPPPLNAPATRRVVAAFAGVARELAASVEARAAGELNRATARATRRTARTQSRVVRRARRGNSRISPPRSRTRRRHGMRSRPAQAIPRRSAPAPASPRRRRGRDHRWTSPARKILRAGACAAPAGGADARGA